MIEASAAASVISTSSEIPVSRTWIASRSAESDWSVSAPTPRSCVRCRLISAAGASARATSRRLARRSSSKGALSKILLVATRSPCSSSRRGSIWWSRSSLAGNRETKSASGAQVSRETQGIPNSLDRYSSSRASSCSPLCRSASSSPTPSARSARTRSTPARLRSPSLTMCSRMAFMGTPGTGGGSHPRALGQPPHASLSTCHEDTKTPRTLLGPDAALSGGSVQDGAWRPHLRVFVSSWQIFFPSPWQGGRALENPRVPHPCRER